MVCAYLEMTLPLVLQGSRRREGLGRGYQLLIEQY